MKFTKSIPKNLSSKDPAALIDTDLSRYHSRHYAFAYEDPTGRSSVAHVFHSFSLYADCTLKKKAMGRAGGQQPWVFVLLVVKLLLLSGPQMKSYISGINSQNMESLNFFLFVF